jgi:hypothetical protein
MPESFLPVESGGVHKKEARLTGLRLEMDEAHRPDNRKSTIHAGSLLDSSQGRVLVIT